MRYLLLVLALCCPAFAGNWYVSKAASGTNAGTSWTNAWTDFSNISFASVACGDTIWIAGGTPYTGSMSINKTCTLGNALTIARVLSSDAVPASAAGWNPAFDSQVVNNGGTVTWSAGAFVTIDGRVGDAQSGVPYGIQWLYTGLGVTAFTATATTINNMTITHIEVQGPSCVTVGTCTGNTWGVNLNQGQDNNTLIDHSWIHRFAEVIRPFKTTGMTIQYSYIGEDVIDNVADHEDWIYASDPVTNLTLIGNVWYSSGNDGIFCDNAGCANLVVINNVFEHWGDWAIELGKTGTCGPYTIVGNTFANDGLVGDGYGFINTGGCTNSASSVMTNNIFYNTTITNFSNTQATFNAGTFANGFGFSCGTGCFQYSVASPIQNFTGFINWQPAGYDTQTIVAADIHLSSAGKTLFQGKGENLTAQCGTFPAFCIDRDGNSRPASGPWDLGAFIANPVAPTVPAPGTGMFADLMEVK